MKKSFICVALFLFFVPACKKAYDYIEANPNADMKNCSLLKIVFGDPWSDTKDSIVFTYNSCGDPVTGTRPSPKTGAPNYIFKYDKKGRLTDFAGLYADPTSSEFWHKYFYDGMGRIVLDSNYIFCRVENGQPVNPDLTPAPDRTSVTFYYYDTKCRIIKDSTVSSSYGLLFLHTYAYDANGNKIGAEYDQKLNFRRTNKIWMFLEKDYSVNNPFVANNYNSSGLPTKINLSPKGGYLRFLENYFTEADITYSCK